MDALGWIFAIIVLLVFGKSFNIGASATFSQDNAVPTTDDNLPQISNQNQITGNPANQQPPWRITNCPSLMPPSPSLPMSTVATLVGPRRVVLGVDANPVITSSYLS